MGDQHMQLRRSLGLDCQKAGEISVSGLFKVCQELRRDLELSQVSKVIPVTLIRHMHARVPVQPF